MKIEIEKITDEGLLRWACGLTINAESNITLDKIYANEHSPIRTQLFKITMFGIPTFVSTHFVRHTIGATHFVKSNREDRSGYTGDAGRHQPVNHGILCNAQALIQMARKRLCYKSHIETVFTMSKIRTGVMKIDRELALKMVQECSYRGGVCHEDKPCGLIL